MRFEELLKPKEVGHLFQVSTMTVYRLIHNGQLPACRVGRSFRIPRASVEALMAQGFRPAT